MNTAETISPAHRHCEVQPYGANVMRKGIDNSRYEELIACLKALPEADRKPDSPRVLLICLNMIVESLHSEMVA